MRSGTEKGDVEVEVVEKAGEVGSNIGKWKYWAKKKVEWEWKEKKERKWARKYQDTGLQSEERIYYQNFYEKLVQPSRDARSRNFFRWYAKSVN